MIYYRENRSIIPAGLGPCMTYILNFKLILLAALITVGLRNVADQSDTSAAKICNRDENATFGILVWEYGKPYLS